MDAASEDRFRAIEKRLGELQERLSRLEGRASTPPSPSQAPARTRAAPPPYVPPREQPQPQKPPARDLDLEDLLGGRVLAWVGGAAVVLGVVFFLVMAVSRGWIDEPTRVVLAFVGSTALLVLGLYLHERHGQTQAALAAVASSIAALYASDTAATQLYELISPEIGLAVAALIGATATAIAVRWGEYVVGGLGILGAILSPVLVDAGTSGTALTFMALALLSSTAVLLWRRWDWLAALAFVLSAPQLLAWVENTYKDDLALTLAVLVLFWFLYLVAAIGYELREVVERLRVSSGLLLAGNSILVSGTGYFVLTDLNHDDGATTWILGLALAHVALGAGSFHGRMSNEIAALMIAAGIGLSAIGFALALSGPALVLGWAAQAVALAWVARRSRDRRAGVGSAALLVLATAHVLMFEAPPDSLGTGVDDLGRALFAIAALAVAYRACSRLFVGPKDWPRVLDAVSATAFVYLPSVAIVDTWTTGDPSDPGQKAQLLLSAFWSATGFTALVYGLLRDDRSFRVAGLALLGVSAAKVFLYDLSELDALYRVFSFIVLGLLLLAGAFAYQRIRPAVSEEKP